MNLGILVVDDMPIIADGLSVLIEEELHRDCEVFSAYTAVEALAILDRNTIDVIVADIRMPGVDGLELLQRVHQRWPQRKVIFVTSYDRFDYARKAVALGATDFVLKAHGDERILEAVRRAADDAAAERVERARLAGDRARLDRALPVARRQVLQAILEGVTSNPERMLRELQELQTPLDINRGVLLAAVRMDDREPHHHTELANAVQDGLDPVGNSEWVDLDSRRLLVLFQPRDNALADAGGFLVGAMQSVQQALSDSGHPPITVSLSEKEVAWRELAERRRELLSLLVRGVGSLSKAVVVLEDVQRTVTAQPDELWRHVGELSLHLDYRRHDAFLRALSMISESCTRSSADDDTVERAIQAIAGALIRYAAENGLESVLGSAAEADILTPEWRRRPPGERISALLRFSEAIFSALAADVSVTRERVVADIHAFVERNLSEDVSLIRIADHVGLNPSYLSRLYKELTGASLSNYIRTVRLARASELLTTTDMRISEVASAIGYYSTVSFDRFFKSAIGKTPGTYRHQERTV